MAGACGRRDRRRWRRSRARRRASPKSARRCRPGAKAGESLTGIDELLGGLGRRAGPAAPGGAADRARRGRASAARRGAGGARPGADRGGRGRGPDRPRGRGAGLRSGAAGGGRGAAVRHSRRLPASIASSPTRLPALGERDARAARTRSRRAASGLPSSTRELVAARQRLCRRGRRAERGAREAAARLDAAVAAELAPLKLDAARFRTGDRRRPSPARRARDRVEFEVSTNPGAPFGPLIKIA